MRRLVEGVEQFQNNEFPKQREVFAGLDAGQSPETLFITCSDSRIVPNLITQTEPGELFIIRNAGNVVPPYDAKRSTGESATIEYAVTALGVSHIVVCGHSQCGAMKGLLDPKAVSALPQMADWLRRVDENTKNITVNLEEDEDNSEGSAHLLWAIRRNVIVQMSNLYTHPSVVQALAEGKVRIWGWVYHIASGEVEVYDPLSERFLPLEAPWKTTEN